MMEKPILFNTEMVRAILEGRKTVTRRVVKQFVPEDARFGYTAFTPDGCISVRGVFADGYGEKFYKLPYQPGDILWVRETWTSLVGSYLYRADQKPGMKNPGKWRPSIHMPREAARIFLRVTDVRVEWLQEIDEDGAIAEGCSAGRFETTGGPWGVEDDPDEWTAREDFSHVWDSTIKPADRDRYGWAANPWVWVIGFERCDKPDGRSGTDECGWRPASTPPEQDGRYLAKYCYQHNSPTMIHFYGTLKYYATDQNPHWQHSGIGLTVEWWMPIPHTPDEEMEE